MFRYNEAFDNIEDAVQWAYLSYERDTKLKYEANIKKVNDVLKRRGDRYER